MSLFSSLTVAVSGLAAQSTAIGNISNNLANTSTTAYKSVGTSFEALVTASSNSSGSGGVTASAQYANDVEGTISSSSVSTYMAISGSGYYAVKKASTSPDGTVVFSNETYYTRRGDFTLDKDGYMVNGAGYYLVGWTVNSTTGDVDTASVNPIQVSQLLDNPVSTTTVDYSANLPASQTAPYTAATSTISVYDALGVAHDMSLTWVKTAVNTWDCDVTIKGGRLNAGVYSDYMATIPMTFNSASNVGSIASIVTGSNYSVIDNSSASENKAQISVPLNFDGAGAQTLIVSFGDINKAKGTTQYADTSLTVSSFTQNGIPRGSFQNVSVDTSGTVTLNYDNGQAKTFYQIPIVQFYAQNKLAEITGDAYSSTINSGSPRYNSAGTVGAGTIESSSLEGSNVDIADQFSSLIQSQQVYSANAKTISAVNSMLETIMNIVR